MGHALHLVGSISRAATRIRESKIREFDLIQCDDKRLAYMVSVGLEGAVIQKRDQYKARGIRGFNAYLMAFLAAYFRDFKGMIARLAVNGESFEAAPLLSLMIMKQPYYGYGLKVMPEARLDDGQLHLRLLMKGVFPSLAGGITSLTIGNRAGVYRTAEQISVTLDRSLLMQADGDAAWEAKEFHFKVLPKALRMKA
jgi:diacylglycerol kinase family enzyme